MYIMGWGAAAKFLAPIVIDLIADKVLKKEDGGYIKKTQLAQIHAGEYVLPKGVKPTPAQRRAVAKKKITKQKAKAKAPKKPQLRKPAVKKSVVKKKRKDKK
tara:strand:+ start:703 stop:1008 length:306 start_codon:yes stop_codon:yes gene_type:complete